MVPKRTAALKDQKLAEQPKRKELQEIMQHILTLRPQFWRGGTQA